MFRLVEQVSKGDIGALKQ